MYFAVTRERGPAWDGSRAMSAQAGWREHADYMNGLVRRRVIILGGPLDQGARILLIVEADSETAIRSELAADPWTRTELLSILSVERWEIQLGEPPNR